MFKTTGNNGYRVTFENGCTVSVQWGRGTYSSNRNTNKAVFHLRNKDKLESELVEVGAWDKQGNWIKLGDDGDVVGRQTAEQVLAIMNKIAAL